MYAKVTIPDGAIVRYPDDSIGIEMPDTYASVLANSKDEFIKVLNTLGFEVMDALPEVTDYEPSPRRAVIDGLYYYFGDDTPEYLRKHARRMLAAARWLEVNSLVDEDDVEALVDLIGDRDTARRLLASGKVTVNR